LKKSTNLTFERKTLYLCYPWFTINKQIFIACTSFTKIYNALVKLVVSVLLTLLVFCVVQLCVLTFWVPCCDVRYDFRIITMFGSSLPPVVCGRTHVLFTLFLLDCVWWCPTHIVLYFSFVFGRLVYPMLPFSLNFPFLLSLWYSPTFI
jgi:hypothetical protein